MAHIYSNSFLHFTSSYENLKKILVEGFKVFFCKEEIYSSSRVVQHIGIPMVSFCDIPLAHIAENNYGKYCIAMKRPWGIEHKLQPVLYYPNNKECQSTQMIMSASQAFLNNPNSPNDYRILGYAKPLYKIERGQENDDRSLDNYKEREWRKVYASRSPQKWMTVDEYTEWRGDVTQPKRQVGSPLKFDAKDVDFIIVSERDRNDIIEFLMRGDIRYIGGKENVPAQMNDREILLSKIVTYESLSNNI